MKVIVIGGVAAGMSAASKIKRTEKDAEITVYERGGYLSYGACGIPYFVSGANDDYKKMIARTQEDFSKIGIATFLHHEVVRVAPDKKQVMVRNIENGNLFIDSYDKLMISTGASPVIPPIKGSDKKGIYSMKTLDGAIALKEELASPDIRNVVIVGGGYIGIEAAESLSETGKNVRVVEFQDRILQNYDPELTDIATEEFKSLGASLNLGERVLEIAGGERVQSIVTDKNVYPADLIIMAVGVRPNTAFLKGSGVALAKNGAVIIDREMRTNIEDIYSAGDCAEVYNMAMQENAYLPLGTTANKCGRLAGVNMLGNHVKYMGTLGCSAIKVGSLEMAKVGLSEADAKRLAIDYGTVFTKAPDHAHYYPNHTLVWIKLIFEKQSKRLLGAQTIGKKNAVLRADVLAIAIQNRMTASELGMSDLCYAPPFAGVWDAVHIACNAVK